MKELFPQILEPGKYEKFLSDLFFGNKQGEPNWLSNNPIPVSGAVIMMDIPHAQRQLKMQHAKICKRTLALCMAYLNRKFRQCSRGLYLQQDGFDEIRKLLQQGERVVLMPVYRSFVDFPILFYSLFVNKIELPFTIGNGEDLVAFKQGEKILKRCGYMHVQRSRDQSLQRSYISQATIREILNKYKFLIMF